MLLPVTHVSAFLTYVVSMSITPGPNNAMLAMLGARHGWRRALPAVAGVMVGLFGLLVLAGTGVAAAVAAAPVLSHVLLLAGVAYMTYMAIMLWRADPAQPAAPRPSVGFFEAVALQAVNPKALLMALTAAGTFLVPAAGWSATTAMALLFVCLGAPFFTAWALLGERLAALLRSPARARWFTRGMALVVAATAVSMAAAG